jgi:peptidoglycan/LPS O-acetylase OafA/YrhL
VFFGSLLIALPAAWLSWHLVEKRALRWGRNFIPARVSPSAAPSLP